MIPSKIGTLSLREWPLLETWETILTQAVPPLCFHHRVIRHLILDLSVRMARILRGFSTLALLFRTRPVPEMGLGSL